MTMTKARRIPKANPSKPMPEAHVLQDRFNYDPLIGTLIWRDGPRAGMPAGAADARGYKVIKLGGTIYKNHRLIWKMVTGREPTAYIDHCNGDPSDNRWANLREATSSANNMNRRRNVRSPSPYKGVVYHHRGRKWQASIGVDGSYIYLGWFDSVDDAAAAYAQAAKKYHGEYARVA